MSEKRKEILREWSELDTELRPEILDKWKVDPPQGYLDALEVRLLDNLSIKSDNAIRKESTDIVSAGKKADSSRIHLFRIAIIGMAALMCCILATLVLFNAQNEKDALQIDDETALLYLEEDMADWEVADLVYADILEDHQVLYDDISLEADDLEKLENEFFNEELLVE